MVDFEGVFSFLFMRSVIEGVIVDLYVGGDFEFGDCVIMVGDSG